MHGAGWLGFQSASTYGEPDHRTIGYACTAAYSYLSLDFDIDTNSDCDINSHAYRNS